MTTFDSLQALRDSVGTDLGESCVEIWFSSPFCG